jgi:hypothetical protein
MIICVWSTVHFNIPIIRHSLAFNLFLRVGWMLISLIAPEALFFAAINERIDAGVLVKNAVKCLPSEELANPGMLARAYNYSLGRARSKDVSTTNQTYRIY